MWGWNPANTIHVTNTNLHLAKSKEKGTKIICVDPRFTDSVATYASQWIPIRPATDTAMLVAMAYVIIKGNLQDQYFLDTYTIGFEKFRDYVLGAEDETPKTPAWAEAITGVKSSMIENLAREYATTKPAALITGWAPGRTPYGEQFHRAASALAAMTGNIGVYGGNPAGTGFFPIGLMEGPRLAIGENPVEKENPYPSETLDFSLRNRTRVPTAKLFDAILQGKRGGYPEDIKMIYSVCGNPLNQLLNVNKGVEAFKKVEFIVVHEQFMTPTAKFADILLPVNTSVERDDFLRPWMSGPYYIYSSKAIESLYESKSDFEICQELAPRLGILNYSEKKEDEWVRDIADPAEDASKYHVELNELTKGVTEDSTITSKTIPPYDALKKTGFYKIPLTKPMIAFRGQIEDPKANPFPTPSGKIEIYSQRLADTKNPKLPPIPKYIEPWEGPNDPLAKKYPLQLISNHSKTRAHSSLANIPWLKEVEPQRIWMNPIDATPRGIGDGDEVRVFNDRGESIIPARITERIMPGIVFMGEGAWYNPDEKGIDRGGSPNVLTKDEYSPGGAFCCNSCLVEVEKV
jgi:anaerobic dimethyl sulfoxide reductase subunit A